MIITTGKDQQVCNVQIVGSWHAQLQRRWVVQPSRQVTNAGVIAEREGSAITMTSHAIRHNRGACGRGHILCMHLVRKSETINNGYRFDTDSAGRPQVRTGPEVADDFIDALNDTHDVRVALADFNIAVLRAVIGIANATGTLPVLAFLKDQGIDIVKPRTPAESSEAHQDQQHCR